jgi:hypothetical protein
MNLDNTSHVNFPNNNRNFSSKLYMAAVSWTKKAQVHLDEVANIREHLDSLQNLLPDKPADNVNHIAHNPAFFEDLQHRINMDSYIPDESILHYLNDFRHSMEHLTTSNIRSPLCMTRRTPTLSPLRLHPCTRPPTNN